MKIENAQYIKSYSTDENCAINCIADGVHVSVPIGVEGNRHWQAIQEWLKEDGNEIAAAD